MKLIKSFWLITISSLMMVGAVGELGAVQITKKSSEVSSKTSKPKMKARYSFKKGAKNQKVLEMLAKK